MQFTAKTTCITMYISLIIALLIGAKLTHIYVFGISRYSFTFDPVLSASTCDDIANYIQKNFSMRCVVSNQLFKEIQQHFPYIKSLQNAFIAPGVVQYTIEATRPLVKIDDSLIVDDADRVLPTSIFVSSVTQHLFFFKINNSINAYDTISTSLATCIKQLSPSLFKRYYVCWHDEFELHLYDKFDPTFSFICNTKTIPDQRVIAQSTIIKQNIVNGKQSKTKQPIHWVADLRFDRQIILFSEKGG